ncbi:hypothetical protein SAMN04487983_102364 [Streptomyces sp. yr375]|uniref:hypothetical protein n=1 Tax=Streptomyces sp. yr375 TaxID=1761906 RepID=UPI0008CD83F3|nr:hypothetical protein [Streptomyces sp. yr375]SER84087.1 hypothetical protein SAMN04487983_102364 [Streptomyces sp. yr375]
MFSSGRPLRRRALGAGVSAGLVLATVVGATAVSTGTASAATPWTGQVLNSGLPSGTNSVRLSEGGGSSCATIVHGTVLSNFNFRATIRADLVYTLRTYRSTNCSGAEVAGASTYRLPADSDRADTGLDCKQVAFQYPRGVHWVNYGG